MKNVNHQTVQNTSMRGIITALLVFVIVLAAIVGVFAYLTDGFKTFDIFYSNSTDTPAATTDSDQIDLPVDPSFYVTVNGKAYYDTEVATYIIIEDIKFEVAGNYSISMTAYCPENQGYTFDYLINTSEGEKYDTYARLAKSAVDLSEACGVEMLSDGFVIDAGISLKQILKNYFDAESVDYNTSDVSKNVPNILLSIKSDSGAIVRFKLNYLTYMDVILSDDVLEF